MLIKELKNVEANGIITRKDFATVPTAVELIGGMRVLDTISTIHIMVFSP